MHNKNATTLCDDVSYFTCRKELLINNIMINSKLGESIALGIVTTVITNVIGVSPAQSAIVGAAIVVLFRAYVTVDDWRKKIEE
jgi:hypothetical protein